MSGLYGMAQKNRGILIEQVRMSGSEIAGVSFPADAGLHVGMPAKVIAETVGHILPLRN